MATTDLKTRLEQLENQVAQIQSTLLAANSNSRKDWRQAVEQFAGDPDLLAVFEEAAKLREADRKKSQRVRTPRNSPSNN